jgi:hypothetical protein
MRTVRRRFALALMALVVSLAGVVVASDPASAGDPVSVTVRILRVAEVSCDEGDFVPCPDDPYARVDIAGQGFQDSDHIDNPDPPDVRPYWQFTRTVDSDLGNVPVTIQIWDDEDSSADDLLDACNPGGTDINVNVDLASGNWTGDTPANTGFCAGDHVKVTFDISLSGNGDFDGDGIPDGVERFGVRDGNGNVVSDLAALGADPCRPTIAVEIDFMNTAADHSHQPLPAALAEAAAMFDNAPTPTNPGCPYAGFPKKASGVDLISVVDDGVMEQANTEWGAGADAIRDANFSPDLRPFFHYSLWIHQRTGGNAGSSGVCCSSSGKDPIVSLGGWTNNVGSVREQSGTYVHELGHALGLGHGGGDGSNCKPNYLSVMSYSFQTAGIGDPTLPANNVDTNNNGTLDSRLRLDYSRQALPALVETALNENAGIGDGTDITLWSNDGGANTRSAPGNGPANWDADANPDGTPNLEPSVSVDVNNRGFTGCQASPNETLNGFDDWANLKFRAALSANAGFSPAPATEMTYAISQLVNAQVAAALQPDLSLSLAASPDPVLTGSNMTFTAIATNVRLMPADDVEIALTLPAGTSIAGCTTSAGGTCSGTSAAFAKVDGGATATATFTANVACPVPNGTTLTGTANVSSDPSDADASNNTDTATVTASNPPPVISGLGASPSTLWPPNHKMRNVAVDYTVTDNCGVPTVTLAVSSNEAVNGTGDGDAAPDWVVVSPVNAQLRAERSGSGSGRTYTLTVGASDSGNGSSQATTTVQVPH